MKHAKSILDAVLGFLKKYPFLYGLPVVIIGGAIYLSSGGSEVKTLTVTRGPFIQSVSVSGRVEANNEVDMGFAQSGRTSGVFVREGQFVGYGQLLAEVENGDLRAALLSKQATRDRASANLDALKRGARPEELAVSEASVSSARAAVQDALLSSFSVADGAVHTTIDQFMSNPQSATPQLNVFTSASAAKASLESGRIQIEPILDAWPTDAAGVQSALSRVSALLGDALAALTNGVPSQSITQAQIDTYKTNVGTARATVSSALSSLSSARAALTLAERNYTLTQSGASSEDVRAEEALLASAEADVQSAVAALRKTQIFAPFSGTVTKLDAKVGKIVSPNTPEVSLIGTGAFKVESFVPEINVSKVHVGDEAIVTFDAYGSDVSFPATVASLDLGQTQKDGVSTYRAVLIFGSQDERVRSGMTANVNIVTEKKEGVIAVPEGVVSALGKDQVVTVLVGDKSESRVVTTGSVSSLGMIEILSGLSEGDLVVLP